MFHLHFFGHVFVGEFFIDMPIKQKQNLNMFFELDLLLLLVSSLTGMLRPQAGRGSNPSTNFEKIGFFWSIIFEKNVDAAPNFFDFGTPLLTEELYQILNSASVSTEERLK